MCQCGCADTWIDKAFKIPSGVVVAYDVYYGCRECFAGPGLTIYVYPNAKSEWIRDVKIEPYIPDEYGGESGHGIPVSFFEVQDLVKAAESIGGTKLEEDGYDSVTAWLEDYGLEMMQDAMRLFTERVKKLNEPKL
jgi:hypothetical protein